MLINYTVLPLVYWTTNISDWALQLSQKQTVPFQELSQTTEPYNSLLL